MSLQVKSRLWTTLCSRRRFQLDQQLEGENSSMEEKQRQREDLQKHKQHIDLRCPTLD